jgi:pimeloyl-ACP methyl ester carboxylesterase
MREEQVHVTGHVAADASAVWAIAGDFPGAWHPAIATIRAERGACGRLVRAFTVEGEDALYREQLVYRSDSDRALMYRHLQGIAGAERYVARLQVFPDGAHGSRIEWSAQLAAEDERAKAIATGTKAIFEMGIAALNDLAAKHASPVADDGQHADPGARHSSRTAESTDADARMENITIDGDPRLTLTATPPKSGPLILFLHGIGGSRTNWLSQLQAASAFGRAASLDLRGYGKSRLGPAQSTVDDYCADILRVMETLHADRLILCGLSYGSWIATSFAMRHPEKLMALILSGGCTGMSEASVAEREAFLQSRRAPLDQGRTPADFAPGVVSVLAGPSANDEVKRTLLASMAAISAATYRDALNCFTHPPERFDFARLTMPVLMMTGEHDRLAAPAEIRGVAGRIAEIAPDASVRFEVIADAGHVCNLERPEAYNEVLTEFLSELTS